MLLWVAYKQIVYVSKEINIYEWKIKPNPFCIMEMHYKSIIYCLCDFIFEYRLMKCDLSFNVVIVVIIWIKLITFLNELSRETQTKWNKIAWGNILNRHRKMIIFTPNIETISYYVLPTLNLLSSLPRD